MLVRSDHTYPAGIHFKRKTVFLLLQQSSCVVKNMDIIYVIHCVHIVSQ